LATQERNAREIELKYAVDDPAAVRELLEGEQLGGLVPGPWREVSVSDRYLDTASRSLERAGYGARLRHSGRRTTLTVKSAAKADADGGKSAKHELLELEGRATRGLDPHAWPQSAARTVVESASGGERLRTLFTIDQRRLERDLCRVDGSVAAVVSLDEANVSRLGRSVGSFTMLEVELATDSAEDDPEGAEAVLDGVADHLESSGLLRPEASTKEHLGLQLVKSHARRQEKPPRRPGVVADDPLAEAGRKVLRLHLLRMLEAENGTRDGDVESVHRMRVATRRMRAAWRVFNGAYKRGPQRRYVDELRQVAQALGGVRDMDVQLERLRDYGLTGAATAVALEPLVLEWQRRRDDAREVLLDLLESDDYEHFVGDYVDFTDTPGAGAVADGPGLVREAAAGRIWRAYERLRTYDEIVPFADVPTLHELRIDCKRLRYTLEFFADVLPDAAASLVAELTEAQDHLGLMNDAHVAENLTRSWLMERAAQLPIDARRAAGAYLASSERDVERLRRSFGRQWRGLMSRTFRRRLAVAIGEV
jgi:CHAD domain-containing protein